MSKKRDIDQLITKAMAQGITFEYLPSGHWKATNLQNGKQIRIASTPRSRRGVLDARARLRRIGFEPVLPPKRKVKEDQMLKIIAQGQKEAEMPKLGELASLKSVMTAENVREDIPMAAYTLWNAIHVRLGATKDGNRSKNLAGYQGKVWNGSRSHLMDDLWPGLDRETKTQVGTYLSGSKNMAALVRGRGGMESIWWISDEFREVSKSAAKRTSANWWTAKAQEAPAEEEVTPAEEEVNSLIDTGQPRVTPADMEVKVETQPKRKPRGKYKDIVPSADGLFHCEECSFAVRKFSSLMPHLGKLMGRTHPNDGAFKCKFCVEIMPTAKQMQQHHDRNHKIPKSNGVNYCPICVDYYEGATPYEHRGLHIAGRALEKMEARPKASVTEVTPDDPYVVTPSKDVEDGTVVNPERVLQQILDELGVLRVTNMDQRTMLRTLHEEKKALEEEIGHLKDKMAENEKFVESIRKQLLS
jgi:hypothetical protein